MQITDVRVRKVTKEGKMKAVVSITIDNEFVVHDIKVIDGEKGLFIACQAVRQQTASTGISHIQLIPIPVNGFRERSLRNTRKRTGNRTGITDGNLSCYALCESAQNDCKK